MGRKARVDKDPLRNSLSGHSWTAHSQGFGFQDGEIYEETSNQADRAHSSFFSSSCSSSELSSCHLWGSMELQLALSLGASGGQGRVTDRLANRLAGLSPSDSVHSEIKESSPVLASKTASRRIPPPFIALFFPCSLLPHPHTQNSKTS